MIKKKDTFSPIKIPIRKLAEECVRTNSTYIEVIDNYMRKLKLDHISYEIIINDYSTQVEIKPKKQK